MSIFYFAIVFGNCQHPHLLDNLQWRYYSMHLRVNLNESCAITKNESVKAY